MSVSEEAFLSAAEEGDIATVNQALEQGVDVNCTNVSGRRSDD